MWKTHIKLNHKLCQLLPIENIMLIIACIAHEFKDILCVLFTIEILLGRNKS